MRIVCPSCTAAYDVPEAMLAGHQAVSCARCGHEWQPTETAPAAPPPELPVVTRLEVPAPPLPASPLPASPRSASPRTVSPRPAARETVAIERRGLDGGDWAIDRLMAAPQPTSRMGIGARLAWIGSLVVLVLLFAAAYAWRGDVMAAWPPSVRLYAVLGLAGPMP
jgi:predicted Zn finger-like uncharacterized protein